MKKLFTKISTTVFIFLFIFVWSLTNFIRIPIINFPQPIPKVLAATNTETFTSSGTWTAPAGVSSVDVEAWGAGGGGGTRSTSGCGGGGGGGAYSKSSVNVTAGNSYSYTVGSGGSPANAGGDTSFNTNSVIAKGGSGVANNTRTGASGGLASGSTGSTKYSGGSGYTCPSGSTSGGGGGGSGGTGSNGTSATSSSGASAVSGGGPGGNGATSNANGSSPASGPGGGGGGAYRSSGTKTGGTGYSGQIKLTYTIYTVLGDGTDPDNSSIGPGASATEIDRFSFADSYSTDSVTDLTITLAPAGAYNNVASVDVQTTGGVSKCSTSSVASNTVSLSSCNISVTTSSTEYKILITPKSHANMPTPNGNTYATTATVTDWTGTNTHSGTDTDSATVTIDNASPNAATSLSGTARKAKVNLNWTTSNSADFNTTSGSVIYRWASGSAGAEVPAEGSTPGAGDTNGAATVACVISSNASTSLNKTDGNGGSAGCTTSALTNGQSYTYKIFQKDTNGNFNTGTEIGTFTPTDICSSQTTGNWSSGSTWTGGCSGASGEPVAGDAVVVSAGNTVTVDESQSASNATINNTGTLTFANGGTLTLNGTSGTLLTNSGTFTSVSNSSVIITSATAPTAIFSGSFTGANAFNNLTFSPTITGAVGYTVGAAFTVNGSLTIDPTSVGSNTLTVTLGGTTIVSGLTDIKAETSATSVLNTGSNYALTTGTLNIEAGGTLVANSSTITINGTTGPLFTRTGTFTPGSSTVIFSETVSDLTLTSGTVSFNNLQISMNGHTGTLGNTISIAENLVVSAGTLADGGYQISGNASGSLSLASGTTLVLGGSTATTFPTSFTAGNISLNSTSTVTYASTQAQTISGTPTYGNLTLSGASTKSAGADISLTGNWTLSSGSFSGGSYTVYLSGADSSTQTITGSTTFNNLSATTTVNTAGRTIRYTAGTTTTVTGTWTMNGASGKVLTLESTGTAWTITPTTYSTDYLLVSYSTNTNGTICATHSTDGENNSGWNFASGAACNTKPTSPTLNSPSNGANHESTTPTFKLTSSDNDDDYLMYKIAICEDSEMTTNCQTYDQTATSSGWLAKNANEGTAYGSGTKAIFAHTVSLTSEKTYYWKGYSIDPGGTNTWSDTQAEAFSFTTKTVDSNKKNKKLKGTTKVYGGTVVK